MEKPRRRKAESTQNITVEEETECHTVFIDTNLDTHFAMIVTDSDTVALLKRKVILEHLLCFPELGEISIHALKVKRKGHFYHLSDSVLVKRAFEESKKNWFLSVDASALKKHGKNQQSYTHTVNNQLPLLCLTYDPSEDSRNIVPGDTSTSAMHKSSLLKQCNNQRVQLSLRDSFREVSKDKETEYKHISDECSKKVSSDCNRMADLKLLEKFNVTSEGGKIAGTTSEHDGNNSSNVVSHVLFGTSMEPSTGVGSVIPTAKKKRKVKKQNEGEGGDQALIEKMASKDDNQEHPTVTRTSNSKWSNLEPPDDHHLRNNPGIENMKRKTDENSNSANAFANSMTAFPSAEEAGGQKRFTENGANYQDDSFKQYLCGENGTHLEIFGSTSSKVNAEGKLTNCTNMASKDHNQEPLTSSYSSRSEKSKPEPPNDHHMRTSSNIEDKKRKRKRKRKRDDEISDGITALTSSVEETGGQELFKENRDNNKKDLAKQSDIGHGIQTKTLNRPSEISYKDRHVGLDQELAEGNVGSISSRELHSLNNNICHSANANDISDGQKINLVLPEESKPLDLAKADVYGKKLLFSADPFPGRLVTESGKQKRKKSLARKNKSAIMSQPKGDELEHKPENASAMEDNRDGRSMIEAENLPLTPTKKDLLINHDHEPKGLVVSSELSEAKGVPDSGGLESNDMRKRRAKESGAKNVDVIKQSNGDLIGVSSASEGFCETKKDDSCAEGKEVFKRQSASTSYMVGDGEEDNYSLPPSNTNPKSSKDVDARLSETTIKEIQQSSADSLSNSPSKRQSNALESSQLNEVDGGHKAENYGAKNKRSGAKKKKSGTKNFEDIPSTVLELGVKEPATSIDRIIDVDKTSKGTRKTRFVKDPSAGVYGGTELHSNMENTSRNVELVDIQSADVLKKNSRKNEATVDAHNQSEVPKNEGNEIDFKHYFMPSQPHNDVCADKKSPKWETEMKTRKKSKKIVSASLRTSTDPIHSLQSHEIQSGIKCSCGIDDQESFSKDASSKFPHLPKKSSEVAGNGLKVPRSYNPDQFKTPQPTWQPILANASENRTLGPAYRKNKISSVASRASSSSESLDKSVRERKNTKRVPGLDHRLVEGRKASTKIAGEVVSSAQREKSLLTTPGFVFRDDSNESWADEEGTVQSDASTRTPSDDVSSSGLDGESESSLDSPKNGNNGAEGKEGAGNKKKLLSSDTKNVTMDMIFRSSSRYKAAKLTAESQPDDLENETEDCVPDSQANP